MPPLVGSADADTEELALVEADAEELALADEEELALADAEGLALALVLAVAVAVAVPPPVALSSEELVSKFSPPRSPPELVSVGLAEAAGANTNTATKHNETSNTNLLIRSLFRGVNVTRSLPYPVKDDTKPYPANSLSYQ